MNIKTIMRSLKKKDWMKNLSPKDRLKVQKKLHKHYPLVFPPPQPEPKSPPIERFGDPTDGKLKTYNCGDLIIKTDVESLKRTLNEKFSTGSLSWLELNRLQDVYPFPIMGSMDGRPSEWTVLQKDLNTEVK